MTFYTTNYKEMQVTGRRRDKIDHLALPRVHHAEVDLSQHSKNNDFNYREHLRKYIILIGS